jgi:hypothetical protein
MSTIPVHFARILHDGKKSPGVFLVSQDTAVREVIDVVVLIWLTSWPVEWENQIVHLPHWPGTCFGDDSDENAATDY